MLGYDFHNVLTLQPTGIEFATHLMSKYPQKKIIIISEQDIFLDRVDAHYLIMKFISKFKNAQTIFNEKVVSIERKHIITNSGKKIECDVAYVCTGFKPNSNYLRQTMPQVLTKQGYIRVNEHLQVGDFKTIFAAGDVIDIEVQKLAQNAERHADVVVQNIKQIDARGDALVKYVPSRKKMLISLGPKKTILVNENQQGNTLFQSLI